ncbi:RNA polymerase sigma factor ECF family 11 [Vibrio sp. MACH09]|uniref:sigma-70 family RNA polymerase sigma factor n=1 Tax=Vibrio sp. MACH09 TaxID=3025122 RepID=UPI00278FDF8F|nr:sigma-70 family RNA polymerase sigma factor [Vibrio sp. MACH09]GLO60720.1 RNA polymerase sigma factor ECF family 11 [Vibrio sp. MACH09]
MRQNVSSQQIQKEQIISVDSLVPIELSHWLNRVAEQRCKQAFTHLFQFFSPKIQRFGMQKFNNEMQAKELVQETMTSIWKKAHMYSDDKGAATTWVYTIMRNAAFDMLRKMQHRNELSLADDIWPVDSIVESTQQESDVFKDHLMSNKLLAHVDSLPDAQQAVIKGVYFQELSQEQLAQQLDVPIGTVKSRLRLALAKLKQHMGGQHND